MLDLRFPCDDDRRQSEGSAENKRGFKAAEKHR
jgi:hypothetical protein